MSLKTVHVVFVSLLSVLCFGTAAWLLAQAFGEGGQRSDLWLGLASGMGGIVVVVYGVWFLRKLKSAAYL
ncbi:hypothetical protein [Limisphaera sp. VF-2]|jgi:hypothetical protein|uniref:hypothetical protein n=1 Tax=Limisphaera sp. VF-2 TaxID=3400418 RepID=UPI00175D2183|nr:hypothetical protein [Limisphaera sp.]